MSVFLGAALGLPLLFMAPVWLPGKPGRAATALAPWTALPALLVALLGGEGVRLEVGWLLLGSSFELDGVGRTFLILTSAIWLAAGVYGYHYFPAGRSRRRFFAYHLLTMSANFAVVAAFDTVTFYLAFVAMTLAAFGMIIHEGTHSARRAAIVYLVLAMLGEALMVYGMVSAAHSVGGLRFPALAGVDIGVFPSLVLIAAFGVKAGLPLLHMWLPLAHPEAPTPASAVLSAAMIKAGLLGWLRFLPVGMESDPLPGTLLLVAGLVAAFGGALLGVLQSRPKAVLAYSSVSQMGYMTVAVGTALLAPGTWQAVSVAIAVFAFHHALAKGALFLGAGVAQHGATADAVPRRLLFTLLAIAAAALAGLPFTSGSLAKEHLKEAIYPLAESVSWAQSVPTLLTVAAVGTALLMLRFLALLFRRDAQNPRERTPAGMWLPFGLIVVAVAVAPPALALAEGLALYGYTRLDAAMAWELTWPALLAVLLFVLLLRKRVPQVPPGDIVVPLERLTSNLQRRTFASAVRLGDSMETALARWRERRGLRAENLLDRLENDLRRWDSAGLLLLLLGGALFAALRGVTGG